MIRPGKFPGALFLAGAAVLGLACVGSVGGDGSPGTNNPPGTGGPNTPGGPGPSRPPNTTDPNMPPSGPPVVTPSGAKDLAGPLPLRRLTINEFNNTVRDLLGADVPTITVAAGFSGDQAVSTAGYLGGATVGSANDAKQFLKLSDDIAAASMGRLAQLAPQGCGAPAASAEQGCAQKFIDEFGLRAFRRPLNNDEKSDLMALYTKVRGAEVGLTYPEGIRTLISAMLQSPMFTYRWELGGEPTRNGTLVRLNDYEMASRLSYMVFASMPDADLFAAAAAGRLNQPDQVAEQARRLLNSDKAKIGLGEFVTQWLHVTSVPTLSKDETFTNYTPAVGEMMLKETGTFFASIMQGTGKLDELYTSSSSFVDASLAKLYGQAGVTGAQLQKVALNANQRAGILTHGSFLAAHSDGDEPHPIHRGVRILEKILCTPIPPPANFVPPPVKDVAPNITNRKRFEESTQAEDSCSSCHNQLNGVGFAFENYDAVGGWREMDAGMPVDSSGKFRFASGEVSFKNGVEFVKALAGSKEARDCLTKQFLEYSLRRPVHEDEAGSVEAITKAFTDSQYDLRELLVATTRTRAFTHRLPATGEGQQ